MKHNFGLSDQDIKNIQAVFTQYPAIDQAIIYGSRAKGTDRKGSDIDLTLLGPQLTYQTLLEISWALDELLLPYTFDLSLYDKLEQADIKDHIKRVGKVFYDLQYPSGVLPIMQTQLTRKKEKLITIDWLIEYFPSAFFKQTKHIKPLQIGIFEDLLTFYERLETPPFSKKILKEALHYYSSSRAYLLAQKEGEARVDLYGNEIDVVTAEQARYAHQRYLERYGAPHKKEGQ